MELVLEDERWSKAQLPLNLIARAQYVVREIFKGKIVRHDGSDVEHAFEVANFTQRARGGRYAIVSAYLHDVVEDTQMTKEQIGLIFDPEIESLVDALTDPPDIAAMPGIERKFAQARRLRAKSDTVKLVKGSDQISNMGAVVRLAPPSWDRRKCLNYIYGAAVVYEECRGLSEWLDSKFAEVFEIAQAKFCD
jgi:(p)ppGpp synthase/HD superfamily hydrolase